MGSENAVAVEVSDLVKRYPKAPVDSVAGISFRVRPGEVFGFLGPNGAGKTTTIGILTTRIRPTAGHARVAGIDVVADPVGARRVLGVVPQQNNLDRSLSVRQNLHQRDPSSLVTSSRPRVVSPWPACRSRSCRSRRS